MKGKVSAALVLASAVLAGCDATAVDKAGGGRDADAVVLRMANVRGGEEVQAFADEVMRLSGGKVRVQLTNGWHNTDPGAEADLVQQVKADAFDIGVVGARAWNGLGVRSFDALVAPLQVDSLALEKTVLESDIAIQMLQGLTALGLDGVGVIPGPLRKPAGTKRELVGPGDYQGASIAISAGGVANRTFAALGATAVPFQFEGASIDQFDGIELQISGIAAGDYDGVTTSVTTNVTLWPRPLVIFADGGKLSQANRELLRQAAGAAIPRLLQGQQAAEDEATDILCRRAKVRFVTAGPEKVKQLVDALAPVYTWLAEDQQTGRFLNQIRTMRAETIANPPPSCARHSNTSTTGQHTPIDGAYTWSLTREELVSSPLLLDAGEINDQNWGDFNAILANGRLTVVQKNLIDAYTYGGTYSLNGDVVTMTMSNGEIFKFHWSLFRDTLTLKRFNGIASPTPWVMKAWRRVGDAP